MYKFYFGKNSEEQNEIEVNIEPSIQTEQKKGKKRTTKNTISLVFVEDKIIDDATNKIIAQTEKQSSKFLKMLEEQRIAKEEQEDIQDVLPGWKQPDFDELFSKIDNSIEEQFQKARAQAQVAAGLDPETKQQQRNRIEMEYQERKRKRQEESNKRLEKFKIFPDKPPIEELVAIQECPVDESDILDCSLVVVAKDPEPVEEIQQEIQQEAQLEIQQEAQLEIQQEAQLEIQQEVHLEIQQEILHYPELFKIVEEDQGLENILVEPEVHFSSSYIDKKTDKVFEKFQNGGQWLGEALGNIGEKGAVAVEKIDHMIHLLESRTERRINSIKRSVFRLEHYLERRKKRVAFASSTAIIGILMVTFAVGNFTAYEYMYNGKILGIVKNQEEVYKTIDVIGDKLLYEHNAEITIDKKKDITFNRVLAVGKEIDDKEEVLNRLTYMKDINAKGYAIVIEGMPTAIVASEENARNILDEIQNQYLSNSNATSVEKPLGFEETVIIESTETKLGSIESEEKALAKLMSATAKKQEGEAKPLLTVQTEEILTYYEPIPFAIEYEDTMSKYKGETTVKSKGTEGQKEIVAKVIRTNGQEVEKEILKETTLSQPVAQIVLRGAKEPPKLVGTGTFIYPVRGTLTSRFGYRWGSMHPALDIAAPTGTPIKASDGGTVTFSGYQGSYGYLVEIDHGGNRKTRYAHCSKIFVKVGQKVYQGMHVANVGNTGNSTGPHVHFEVLINGVQKNPLSYL